MKTNYQTLDNDTFASEPGQIVLSHRKLQHLRPDLYGLGALWQSIKIRLGKGWPQRLYIEEQLMGGDSRAAIVISTSPLLVAAYSEDLDCIAMLRFSEKLVNDYQLTIGSRLLTVNSYSRSKNDDPDLIPGPARSDYWTGFHPIIADFVTEDLNRLKTRKRTISEEEWQRTYSMSKEYLKRFPDIARDGRPVYASVPAKI